MSTHFSTLTLLFTVASFVLGAKSTFGQHGSIDREDGVVIIMGDNYDDDCDVMIIDDELKIWLTVRDEEGEVSDIDIRDYNLNHVSEIVFEGFDGNDRFIATWCGDFSVDIPCVAYGGAGNDLLFGGSANDMLDGGPGQDMVIGNWGDDTLRAGTGEPEFIVRGGPGSDTFVMPGTLTWYTRQLVPMYVQIDQIDFDPFTDRQRLFWAANFSSFSTTTNSSLFYQTR